MDEEQSFARVATKCLAAFVAVVVVVLGVFWGLPTEARAASIPPPVEPVPVLPSVMTETVGASATGGLAMDAQRNLAVQAAKARLAATTGVTTADAVVPLTKAATVARGTGGVLLIAPNIGWAIGQGGLLLFAAATGEDYRALVCNTPEWYQGTNAFLSFGVTPDCKATVVTPNSDKPATYGAATYGGTSFSYLGSVMQSYSGSDEYKYCYKQSGPSLVYPYAALATTPAGGTRGTTPSAGLCAGPFSTSNTYVDWKSVVKPGGATTTFVSGPALKIVNVSTNAVVSQMSVTQPDPTRTASCKITWADGTTTTGTGTTYQESAGLPASASSLGCVQAYTSKPGAGPALLPSTIEVDSTDDAGAKTAISTSTVPSFTATEKKSLSPSKPGEGLVLRKVVGTVTDSCNTWAADCSGWWAATSNGTVENTGTATYRCTFGGDPVSLDQCGIYRHTFDTQTSAPVVTDPSTGTDTPWVTSSPSPAGSTDPGVGLTPGDQCMTEWPSAPDPISWVLYPIKCALVWAFVPRTTVVTQVQTQVTTAWAPTAVGQIGALVPTWLTPPTGSGCAGPHVNWTITWPTHTTFDAYPLNACGEPVATIALMARVIASVLLIGYTIFGVTRRISAIVSAPGVGPGS